MPPPSSRTWLFTLLRPFKWLSTFLGLPSLSSTAPDSFLVIFSRCCRMFAYSSPSLILGPFFSLLSFTDSQIGLFLSLTLLGDLVLSLFLTLIADRIGRRRVLLLGAGLMVVSGAVFAVVENFWGLLAAAVIGVISATGGDGGPFRVVEESVLSGLTDSTTRADVLAWYVTTSSIGSAVGTEFAGRAVEYLKGREGWDVKDAYHALFWGYVGMGALLIGFTLCLSEKCEIKGEREKERKVEREGEQGERLLDEREQRDGVTREEEDDDEGSSSPAESQPKVPRKRTLFAQISAPTRAIMYKLWFLLAIDSLADGMVSYSLTNYYLDRKFHLPKSTLGDIISTSYIIASCSAIFAAPLARYLGLINTMVFTHLPSSAAVLLFPIPQGVPLTVTLFFIRTGLNNMDQAPRTAFIAAVVKPEERTAVMGITNMVRTLTSIIGPSVTGVLAGNDRFWIAFVAAGALRIVYDLGLWAMFVNMKLHVHESKEGAVDERREGDEEMVELGPVSAK